MLELGSQNFFALECPSSKISEYQGVRWDSLNFFCNSLTEYVLIRYCRFKNFIFQVSPQEIVQEGQIWTGGGGAQRSVEMSLSPKNPRSIAINSFDVCSRTPSYWNMQSLLFSSSNTINCMSMSAYMSLDIVIVKKIGPTIRRRLMAHHTPTLRGCNPALRYSCRFSMDHVV